VSVSAANRGDISAVANLAIAPRDEDWTEFLSSARN